jgi:hypothetical protein
MDGTHSVKLLILDGVFGLVIIIIHLAILFRSLCGLFMILGPEMKKPLINMLGKLSLRIAIIQQILCHEIGLSWLLMIM